MTSGRAGTLQFIYQDIIHWLTLKKVASRDQCIIVYCANIDQIKLMQCYFYLKQALKNASHYKILPWHTIKISNA